MEHIVILLVLSALGVYALRYEDKLIIVERRFVRFLNRIITPKPKIIVSRIESESEKQARFDSGAKAGNELYGEGLK